jgi:cell division inhibitor SepF
MSVLQRIGAFFSLRDEDEEYFETPEPEPQRRNVVAFAARDGRRSGAEVSVFVPHAFADVTEIADALRARQVVIVNLQGADRGLLQRVVDFCSGVAYTIDGRIQKLAEAMYLVVPPGVTVNAQGIRESLGADPLDFLTNRGATS